MKYTVDEVCKQIAGNWTLTDQMLKLAEAPEQKNLKQYLVS